MRERKRSDYDPINWRYRAEIIGPLPEIIMQTGRKMNRLWNELVAIHNRTPYRYLRLAGTSPHYNVLAFSGG